MFCRRFNDHTTKWQTNTVILRLYIQHLISPDATFPPNTSSEFGATTTVRIPNSWESYHSPLNWGFYSINPNILNFIDELLKVQSETHKISRHKTKVDKEQHLREQMTKYNINTITRFEDVKSLSFKFLPRTYYYIKHIYFNLSFI